MKEPEYEQITYKRRKQKGKRETLLEDLPVRRIEYRLPEDQQICDKCGEKLHEMSQQVRRELKYIPAKLEVVEHVTYVYSCRNCEGNGVNTPVITAPTPKAVLPGSLVSPSLMSHVMTQKYGQGLPLYRQEQQFQSFGIDFSRQNLANWMIHGSRILFMLMRARCKCFMKKEGLLAKNLIRGCI